MERTIAMNTRSHTYLDGTYGRLGWSDHAQRMFRAAVGVMAVALGVVALARHAAPDGIVVGALFAVVGAVFIVSYLRERHPRH